MEQGVLVRGCMEIMCPSKHCLPAASSKLWKLIKCPQELSIEPHCDSLVLALHQKTQHGQVYLG